MFLSHIKCTVCVKETKSISRIPLKQERWKAQRSEASALLLLAWAGTLAVLGLGKTQGTGCTLLITSLARTQAISMNIHHVRRRRDFAHGTVDICSYEGRLKGGGSVRILIRRLFPLSMEGINVASVTRLCISMVSCSDLKATLCVIILSVFFTQIHLFGIINQNHLVTLKPMGQWKGTHGDGSTWPAKDGPPLSAGESVSKNILTAPNQTGVSLRSRREETVHIPHSGAGISCTQNRILHVLCASCIIAKLCVHSLKYRPDI